MGISGHHALRNLSTAPDVSLHTGTKKGDRRSPLILKANPSITMHKGQATVEKRAAKEIQSDYLAAFFGRDTEKLEAIRAEALSAGMCINTDGLCDDERCYCRDHQEQ